MFLTVCMYVCVSVRMCVRTLMCTHTPNMNIYNIAGVQKYTTKIWMCEIDIGNLKYPTFTKLVQVRNFITFFDMRRERYNFSMLTAFYIVSSQPNQRAAPVAHKFVWPRPGRNLNSLVRRQELNSLLFFQIPKILSPRFRCMTSFIPLWSYFLSEVLFWHLWMTHPPRVRVNTCAHVFT